MSFLELLQMRAKNYTEILFIAEHSAKSRLVIDKNVLLLRNITKNLKSNYELNVNFGRNHFLNLLIHFLVGNLKVNPKILH